MITDSKYWASWSGYKINPVLWLEEGKATELDGTISMSYPSAIYLMSSMGEFDYGFKLLQKYIDLKYCK